MIHGTRTLPCRHSRKRISPTSDASLLPRNPAQCDMRVCVWGGGRERERAREREMESEREEGIHTYARARTHTHTHTTHNTGGGGIPEGSKALSKDVSVKKEESCGG
jgi:hypothetical protein